MRKGAETLIVTDKADTEVNSEMSGILIGRQDSET